MKLFIAATIVMLSIVSIVPQASAICASADPEFRSPFISVYTEPNVGVDIDPGHVDPNAQVKLTGSCRGD